MNPLLLAQILQAAVQLAETGSQVYTFLSTVSAKIQAGQAAGTDLTPADWAYLDSLAAQNLAQIKGYASITDALLAVSASTPAPAPAPGA